jgi:hypothetical protein
MTPATRPDRQPRMNVVVAKMRQMSAVTVDMTDQARMTDHTGVAAMADNAVVTVTAAAVRTRIGSSGDERREADDGGRDESEECRTFEHCQRPFGSM